MSASREQIRDRQQSNVKSTNMKIHSDDNSFRARREPNPYARRQDLGQTIKPQHTTHLFFFEFQRKVRRVPGMIAVVQEVVRIVCSFSISATKSK